MYLKLFFLFSHLLVWLKIIFPQNFEDIIPLVSSSQCSCCKVNVILIPDTMYETCFPHSWSIWDLLFDPNVLKIHDDEPWSVLLKFLMLSTYGLNQLSFIFENFLKYFSDTSPIFSLFLKLLLEVWMPELFVLSSYLSSTDFFFLFLYYTFKENPFQFFYVLFLLSFFWGEGHTQIYIPSMVPTATFHFKPLFYIIWTLAVTS